MEKGVILCVDDERVVLNGLRSQIGRDFGSHYSIEIAESGEEALDLVDDLIQSGSEIVVVISDQLMPGIKGHELLKRIHSISPSSYTILLTGQSDLDAVTEAVNHANLYRYISKPWEGNDLIMTIKEAVKGFYQDRRLEEQNKLLERHNRELEQLVHERTEQLRYERDRSEELLLNILPHEVAEELKAKGEAEAKLMEHVTVLFTDFKGFTQMSELVTPKELVKDLHECFSAFDNICQKHGLEKIKTIGDAYMAAGGLPTPNTTHAIDTVKVALEMAEFIAEGKARKIANGRPYFEIRIGIHTGPVVAGIVGVKKFQYDIWGDTVNTASRMESSGEVGRVNISETTYQLVKNEFTCEYRGEVEAKGKGKMGMYFVCS
jgi:class 3 adenylate cyclase